MPGFELFGDKERKEVQDVIDDNSDPDYREKLNEELDEVNNMEIWKVGKEIRKLRF